MWRQQHWFRRTLCPIGLGLLITLPAAFGQDAPLADGSIFDTVLPQAVGAAAETPRSLETIFSEASDAERRRDWTQAFRLYEEAAKRALAERKVPQETMALHRMAIIKAIEKEYGDSEELFRQALLQAGNNTVILVDFAKLFSDQQRYDDAETVLKNAMLVEANNRRVLYNLGMAVALQENREMEGLRYLKLAVGDPAAYRELAGIYRWRRNDNQAEFSEQRAVLAEKKQTDEEREALKSPFVSMDEKTKTELQDRIRQELLRQELAEIVAERDRNEGGEDTKKSDEPTPPPLSEAAAATATGTAPVAEKAEERGPVGAQASPVLSVLPLLASSPRFSMEAVMDDSQEPPPEAERSRTLPDDVKVIAPETAEAPSPPLVAETLAPTGQAAPDKAAPTTSDPFLLALEAERAATEPAVPKDSIAADIKTTPAPSATDPFLAVMTSPPVEPVKPPAREAEIVPAAPVDAAPVAAIPESVAPSQSIFDAGEATPTVTPPETSVASVPATAAVTPVMPTTVEAPPVSIFDQVAETPAPASPPAVGSVEPLPSPIGNEPLLARTNELPVVPPTPAEETGALFNSNQLVPVADPTEAPVAQQSIAAQETVKPLPAGMVVRLPESRNETPPASPEFKGLETFQARSETQAEMAENETTATGGTNPLRSTEAGTGQMARSEPRVASMVRVEPMLSVRETPRLEIRQPANSPQPAAPVERVLVEAPPRPEVPEIPPMRRFPEMEHSSVAAFQYVPVARQPESVRKFHQRRDGSGGFTGVYGEATVENSEFIVFEPDFELAATVPEPSIPETTLPPADGRGDDRMEILPEPAVTISRVPAAEIARVEETGEKRFFRVDNNTRRPLVEEGQIEQGKVRIAFAPMAASGNSADTGAGESFSELSPRVRLGVKPFRRDDASEISRENIAEETLLVRRETVAPPDTESFAPLETMTDTAADSMAVLLSTPPAFETVPMEVVGPTEGTLREQISLVQTEPSPPVFRESAVEDFRQDSEAGWESDLIKQLRQNARRRAVLPPRDWEAAAQPERPVIARRDSFEEVAPVETAKQDKLLDQLKPERKIERHAIFAEETAPKDDNIGFARSGEYNEK